MKTFKCLFLLLILVIGSNMIYAQSKDKPLSADEIKKMADDKKFIFKAKYATPDNSNNRNGGLLSTVPEKLGHVALTTDYSVLMSPDSVASYLPYFGKLDTDGKFSGDELDVTMQESPAKFSTTEFEYIVQQKKKGNLVITIKPKNSKAVQKYIFEFALNGAAKLELSIAGSKTINYEGFFITL